MPSLSLSRRALVAGGASLASAAAAVPTIAAAFAPTIPFATSAEPRYSATEKPIWMSADDVDAKLFQLWERRDVAAAAMREASAAAEAAEQRMPEWSRSGPAYIHWDGRSSAETSAWPALELETLERCYDPWWMPKGTIKVRLSPHEVKASYERAANCDREVRPRWRAQRDRLLEAIAERRRQQADEERKAGLKAAERSAGRAVDRVLDIEDKILELLPATPHTIAAAMLIDLKHESVADECIETPGGGEIIIVARALKMLRPLLCGSIAAAVGELLDNPAKPLGEMAFFVDRKPKTTAA